MISSHYRPSTSNWHGRTVELHKIRGWLTNTSVRLIGINGLGGYGKSTLAAKLLESNELRDNFTTSFWIKLERFHSFSVWGRDLLKLLDGVIDERADNDVLIHAVVNKLSQYQCVLVLDNLESLLREDRNWREEEYQSFLLRWLEYGKKSLIVITSRERPEIPLNMLPRSRWLDNLNGLSVVDGESLLKGLGVQGTSAAIRSVVVQADGHPLLLELIAGTLMEQEEYPLIDLLEENLMKIVGLHQGNQEASAEEILNWSVDRLEGSVRNLLLYVSVYRLPFDVSAAKFMLLEGDVTVKSLRNLAKRSLIQSRKEGSNWRFYFQSLVQEYLQSSLEEKGYEAHKRAIYYYQTIAKTIILNLGDFSPHQEIFYHCCQIGNYSDAFDVLETCDRFFENQGHWNLRVKLYDSLFDKWNRQAEKTSQFSGFLAYMGKSYYRIGNTTKALELFRRSKRISQEISDSKRAAAALTGMAMIQGHMYALSQAIENQKIALRLAEQAEDRVLEVECWLGLAELRRASHAYQSAINSYKRALHLSIDLDDRNLKASTLIGLSSCFLATGHRLFATEYVEEALIIYREIKSRTGENLALLCLGNTYFASDQYELALDSYQAAIEMVREFGDHLTEITILFGICSCYSRMGRYQDALDSGFMSLKVAEEIKSQRSEAEALMRIAMVYRYLDNYQESTCFFKRGLSVANQIDGYEMSAIAHIEIGANLEMLDERKEAQLSYEQAVELLENIHQLQYHGRIQINYKRQLDNLATRVRSKTLYTSRKLNRTITERHIISPLNINHWIGRSSSSQKDKLPKMTWLASTTEYYKSWLRIAKQMNDCCAEAICIMSLGSVCFLKREYEQALSQYEDALAIQKETEGVEVVFELLGLISLVHETLQQYEPLLNSYQRSLEYARYTEDNEREAISLFNLGVVSERLGRQEDALEHYRNSYRIFRRREKDDYGTDLTMRSVQRVVRTLREQASSDDAL